MKCPKCGNRNIETWYGGGRWKGFCSICLTKGLYEKFIDTNPIKRSENAQRLCNDDD